MSFFDSIGNFLGGLFGGGNDPADAANQYYSQIPDILKQYLGHYADRGNQVYPQLQNQYYQLINDPTGLLNQFGQGYKPSPGYQFQVNQATGAANHAAAAGGMLGSPQYQQNVANIVNNLANQDYNQYLGNVLNIYGRGLSGEQTIYNTGAGASGNLGENLANSLINQGNLAYSNGVNQNQSIQQLLGLLLGGGMYL